MRLDPARLDRAVGAVLASAAGDALGSQYEFGPALPDDAPVTFGRGALGHGLGEWTDDTAMAVPILQVLAEGRSLTDTQALTDVVRGWLRWMPTSPDVGAQTRAVLEGLGPDATEQDAREAARRHHEARGRSAGNGSLMRTGPLALGYLADGALAPAPRPRAAASTTSCASSSRRGGVPPWARRSASRATWADLPADRR